MNKKSRNMLMANLYFKNKDFSLAEKCLSEQLNSNPDDWEALRLMAQIHENNRCVDKAFEMHERRYMIDPSRTGAVLDICRVLLMSDVILDQVDYMKWYDLGIKIFGVSNPIMKSLSHLIKGLPSSRLPSQPKEDDLLIKILEKLSIIETRLNKMEKKLFESPEKAATEKAAPEKVIKPAPVAEQAPQPVSLASNIFLQAPKLGWSTASIFGGSAAPIFGGPPAPTSAGSTAPIFGSPIAPISEGLTAPASRGPNAPTSAESTAPIFGSPIAPTSGGPTAPASRGPNAPTSAGSTAPLFGAPTAPTSGATIAPTSARSTAPTSADSTAPIFGSPIAPTSGGPTVPTSRGPNASIFGMPSALTSGAPTASIFGGTFSMSPQPVFQSHKQVQENNLTEDPQSDDPQNDVPIENFCTLKPIEQKTGEEDDDILFTQRCKLFRLTDGQWKERGLDNVKVLKHRKTGLGRLVMRLQVTGKLCLNCWNFKSVSRPSDNTVRWGAFDQSDMDCETRVFLARFKTKEFADIFEKHLQDFENGKSAPINEQLQNDIEREEVELIEPTLDPELVEKARKLKLPELFYHDLKYRDKQSEQSEGSD